MPGLLLGLGLGGFVDGIVLHQILQWHHLLSGTDEYPPTSVANLQVNVTADGLFHAVTWVLVVAGLAALWTTVRSDDRGPGAVSSGGCWSAGGSSTWWRG